MSKCCVEGCLDASTKDITYFNFPASKALRRAWIAAISPSLKPKLNSMVCSRHFLSSDCESARGRTRLRAGAVPTIFDKTKRKRQDSTSSEEELPISNGTKATSDAQDPPTVDKHKPEEKEEKQATETDEGKDESALGINLTDKLKVKDKTGALQNKRNNLHEKLKSLHDKNKSLLNRIEGLDKSKDVGEKSVDLEHKSGDLDDKSNDLQNKSNDLKNESNDLGDKSDGLQIEGGVLQKSEDGLERRDVEERVQERNGEKEGEDRIDGDSQSIGKNQDKIADSAPQPPEVPRDIDKQPEDIEELLTNYHIKQDRPLNIHTVTDEPGRPDDQPVFIEISVDKDTSGTADRGDCLMVMESVQVELDPSELMLPERDEADAVELDDTPPSKEDPISLLTSSDEDDVIIEEPHIDTVEVSDETDEDDVPLVKLLKRRRSEKKRTIAEIPAPDGEADLAKILWGMYEYYCVQCHFTTSSGTEYRRHTASHAKVLMMCQICGYMTASESQFTKHEKQHGEKKYKCHLCSYKAKHNMSLLYHLKGHKAEDFLKSANVGVLKRAQVAGRVFECRNCAYTTKKRCDLKRHMTRRHKKNEDDEDFVP